MATSGIYWAGLWVILPALVLAGAAYNALIAYLHRRGLEGFASIQVAGGTLFTLTAAAVVIGPLPALVVLACFAASGLPMMIGSIWRYLERVDEFRSALRQLGLTHDQTTAPAASRQRDD